MDEKRPLFNEETWAQLPGYFEHLPSAVLLNVWGDRKSSHGEQETAVLCQTLADHFDKIHFQMLPRRVNYPYYPVIGVMGREAETEKEEWDDFGVRIIGRPAGYQLTSLISAIQVVSFRGSTLEPKTRIQLHKLPVDVDIEVMTAADNEVGAVVAKIAFSMAVAIPRVRAFLIMTDVFPEAITRYSVRALPHTVINGRVHIEGVIDEEKMVQQIATAVKSG